jgi:asparagine synthase (glutamine-hydrolysing)
MRPDTLDFRLFGTRAIVAFQNGEIYNYRRLRSELERAGFSFATQSDTEVLAHGYAHWGIEGLLERIDGMYAIAILDRDRRELHLARDRFGEKPLFFRATPGRFAYASDLSVLAALPWAAEEPVDRLSLDRYLALHYVPGDRTILAGIRRVMPGERLRVPLGPLELERHRYYRLPAQDGLPVSEEELSRLIEASVRSRLVADVPVGVFLSGGIDSSLVAAIAARENPQINTFSIGFPSAAHDESPHAREVARHIGSTHHEFVFDEGKFLELLPEVASALDEPLGDQAALPLFWLCREARKFVTVALSGEGADEIFGGYSYYALAHGGVRRSFRSVLRGLARRPPAHTGPVRFLDPASLTTLSGFPLLADFGIRERLVPDRPSEGDEWESGLIAELLRCKEPGRRASIADMASWLPDDLLVKFDRMAMAHSLEGRAPFLHPDVAAAGLSRLAPDQRFAPGRSKVALRRIAGRWVPPAILERPKQGFVLPMRKWLEAWSREVPDLRAYFDRRVGDIVDASGAAAYVEHEQRHGVRNERLLFALVMLAEWRSRFAERTVALRARIKVLAPGYGRT